MKVFARLFQMAAGSKGRALGRLRRGEMSLSPFLVLFAAILAKRTERVFSHKIPEHAGDSFSRPYARMKLLCDEIRLRRVVLSAFGGSIFHAARGNKKPATQRALNARRCGLTVFCFPKRISLRCSQKTGSPCQNNNKRTDMQSWYCLLL